MPADILPNPRFEALDCIGELREVSDALQAIEDMALGETPTRDGIAALLLLIRESMKTRVKAAESVLRGS